MLKKSPVYNGYFPSFFDEIFTDFERATMPKGHVPSVNVKETNDAFEIQFMAPGMSKDAFSVELDRNTLMISGEARKEELSEGEKYTRKEFSFQSFKRSFKLPENQINEDQIDAQYVDGILRIVLPKHQDSELKQTKRITIG